MTLLPTTAMGEGLIDPRAEVTRGLTKEGSTYATSQVGVEPPQVLVLAPVNWLRDQVKMPREEIYERKVEHAQMLDQMVLGKDFHKVYK